MRLLHVTHQYAPAVGGSEQHFADISEELVRRGHQVDVATTRSRDLSSWRSELPGFEQINGVNVHRFRSLLRGRVGWNALRIGNSARSATGLAVCEPLILLGNGPIAPGLAWHILRNGPRYDLIHLQTLPFAHVAYSYVCARASRRPVVITPHIHVDQRDTFDLTTFNIVLRRADLVLADSEREIDYLQRRGVKQERIVVGGIGVHLASFPRVDKAAARARLGLPPDAFILLYVGRKEPYKGLPSLVRVFQSLQSRYAELYLVSAGPSTPASRQLAIEFAGLPRWLDLGSVDDTRKVDLLNACDVLLLPSTGEAFGIVFLEAWAVSKPVVGARAGAIPWVIEDGHDGLLVAPGDDDDLARAIERLIVSPELARELGENGAAKVHQRYTVQRIAERIEDAYGLALAGAEPRSAVRA
jgi:glycosyltransferase involved in cell wall biosynthesis